jgi:hypothetical protein
LIILFLDKGLKLLQTIGLSCCQIMMVKQYADVLTFEPIRDIMAAFLRLLNMKELMVSFE